MNWIIYWFLRATTLIDRLQCPICKAFGTYKLHAACKGLSGESRPYRWMCKFCGYYRAKNEGEGLLVYPSANLGVWAFKNQMESNGDATRLTPIECLRQYMGKPDGTFVWPWRR